MNNTYMKMVREGQKPFPRAIVIGASAGAVEALNILLPSFPEKYVIPLIVVVHLPPDKKSVMAEIFQKTCRMKVREAEDKEPISSGTIYFAPPDYHLLVESKFLISLSSEEPVQYSRPSIDALFESAADALGDALIGIVLTGANGDGAKGLRTIFEAGGHTIVQSPKSAQVPTMPQAAIDSCPHALTMTIGEIATYLISLGQRS